MLQTEPPIKRPLLQLAALFHFQTIWKTYLISDGISNELYFNAANILHIFRSHTTQRIDASLNLFPLHKIID